MGTLSYVARAKLQWGGERVRVYLYLGESRLLAWLGTTAYLGLRAVAEWTHGVHSDYTLLCGCSPEGLSSGAEAVLLCALPSLLLLRTLRLHRGLALGSHGCFGAPRGPSSLLGLCSPPGWHSTNPPRPEFAFWWAPTASPYLHSEFPAPDQNQFSVPQICPCPWFQGPGQDPVHSAHCSPVCPGGRESERRVFPPTVGSSSLQSTLRALPAPPLLSYL